MNPTLPSSALTLFGQSLLIGLSIAAPVGQIGLLAIQRTLDHLTESLAHGQAVELRNFGVFEVKLRKARVGRNPNRPEHDVPIPPRAVVKFKAGKEMKAKVMKLSQTISADGAPAADSSKPAA